MAYKPTEWVDDVTPINAENLNKIENQLAEVSTDYIVEQGVDGIWEYRKWNSGKYDAFYASNLAYNNISANVQMGNIYRSDTIRIDLPTFNKNRVSISATGSLWADYSGIYAFQHSVREDTHIYANYILIAYWSYKALSNSDARLSLQINGVWK